MSRKPKPDVLVAAATDQAATYQAAAYDVRRDGETKTDPSQLLITCPICGADVGQWCGGVGDLHPERGG